jgi:hypothetical protein
MSNRYWENQSGYYDPTAKAAIDNDEKPDKLVRDSVYEIKLLLKSRNLELLNRMVIKDVKSGKVYK